MNSNISIVTLLIIATLTMSFTLSMVTQVQGSHPEAEAERDECLEDAYNMEIKYSDDILEDSESFEEKADFEFECIDNYNEHTEPDFD